jgi:purine-binding chemotaxis protein CheW
LNEERIILGATADGVKDVIEISNKEIMNVPEMGSSYNTEFISGMIKLENKFIMLLEIDKVFSVDEVDLISKTGKEMETESVD